MLSRSGNSVSFDEKKIDALLASLNQCQLPGAAVGIAIAGRPVYRKGFGLANMEQAAVLLPTTRMRIFSVSKHITSLAYMLLCEQKRAHLDEPIGTYLPELHPVARAVTPRMLMSNTSGLTDAFDVSWHLSGTGWSVASEEIASFYTEFDSANAKPGTAWIYNNGGFLLLSIAIERITRQSLEQFLRERIFVPIGMHDTVLRRHDWDFLPNSATLHMTGGTGGYEKSYIGGAIAGEGGVVSTVDDMLRWMAHMDAPVVGSGATWATLKAPQLLANGTSTGYGFGLVTELRHGLEIVLHSGSAMGGSSHIIKVPAAGLDIVVLVNREDVEATLLADAILEQCLDSAAETRPRYSPVARGIFRSPKTGRVIQLFGVKGKQVASIDGTDIEMVAGDSDVLWPTGIHRVLKQALTLVGDDPAQPSLLRFNDFGSVDELLPQSPPTIADIATILGCYRSESTRSEITVRETAAGLQLATRGRFGSVVYQLNPIGRWLWRARSTRVSWLGGHTVVR